MSLARIEAWLVDWLARWSPPIELDLELTADDVDPR